MVSVSPMDKHGYFNYSVNTGVAGPIVQNADVVIVEVNEHMPRYTVDMENVFMCRRWIIS